MRRYPIAAAVLLACAAALPSFAGQSDTDLVTQLMKEQFEKQIENYKAQIAPYDRLVRAAAAGKGKEAADILLEEGRKKAESLKEEYSGLSLGFKVAEKIFPELSGPLGLVKSASDYVHEGTRNWLDWAEQNRFQEFNQYVVQKSRTKEELRRNWEDFKERCESGLNMRGTLPVERPAILLRLEAAYKERLREMGRPSSPAEARARAEAARLRAKELFAERLEERRFRLQKDIEQASFLLKLSGLPVTTENVRRFINDIPFQTKLVEKWFKDIDERKASAAAADEKLAAIAASVQKSAGEDSKDAKADYSSLAREFGLNADRLLNGDISAEQYNAQRSFLKAAAEAISSNCYDRYFPKNTEMASDIRAWAESQYKKNCSAPLQSYNEETARINANLKLYTDKLRDELKSIAEPVADRKKERELDGLTSELLRAFDSDKEFKPPLAVQFRAADARADAMRKGDSELASSRWTDYSWEGKKQPPLAEMRGFAETLSSYAGLCAAYAERAAAARERYTAAAREFGELVEQARSRYSEAYGRSQELARAAGIAPFDFGPATIRSAKARDLLAEAPFSEASQKSAAALTAYFSREAEAWKPFIQENAEFKAPAGERFETLLNVQSTLANGRFDKEMAGRLKAKVDAEAVAPLADSLAALDTAVRLPEKAGPALPLASHEKRAADAEKILEQLARIDFEGRSLKMRKLYEETMTDCGKIRIPSAETAAACQAAADAELALRGYPSAQYLQDSVRKLRDRIEEARQTERYAVMACKGEVNASPEELKTYHQLLFGRQRWVPAGDTLAACAALKARGPAGVTSEDLYADAVKARDAAGEEQVREFYSRFRSAYESRSAAAVMALISPDWSSGDDVGDFQELDSSLRASFRLYDEIKYSVSGLKAERRGGAWQACYEVAIASRIYKRNLRHEEKSSVCEELREEGGKLRIARTLSGRYWSGQ